MNRLPSLVLTALLVGACRTGVIASVGTTDPAPTPPATAAAPSAAPTQAPIPNPSPAPSPAPAGGLIASQVAAVHGVSLVRAESSTPAPPSTVPLVTVTKTELLVGEKSIAKVEPGPLGFDASLKRAQKRAALQILPLEAAIRPLHTTLTDVDVRLMLDRATSYRTALEVMFTCAQAGFTSFNLLVYGLTGERSLHASTPTRKEREASHAAGVAPPVAFLVQPDGVAVSVAGTPIGAGCVKGAPGMTAAMKDGKLDGAALGACVARLKEMSPSWGGCTVAEVSAAPGLDMQTVLGLVAIIERALPVVHFGLITS